MLAAFFNQGFDLAGRKIDALDRSADIFVRRRRSGHEHAARGNPGKAAIVADVAFAVGADRRAVGAALDFRPPPSARPAIPASDVVRGFRPAPPSRPASPPGLPEI